MRDVGLVMVNLLTASMDVSDELKKAGLADVAHAEVKRAEAMDKALRAIVERIDEATDIDRISRGLAKELQVRRRSQGIV
jgi:hypothetical protein